LLFVDVCSDVLILVMAFLNNLLEIRSDAFKIAVHNRRPFAMRTDTIGPWLDALTFLTWVGALTNSALVYLFSPDLLSASAIVPADHKHHHQRSGDDPNAMKELLLKAVLVSLVASHGYMLVSVLVRHVVERVWWVASKEVKEREVEERTVKERFLSGVGVGDGQTILVQQQEREQGEQDNQEKRDADPMGFWEHDEGLEEIQRLSKEA
jgi:anoctamin-10